MTSCSKGPDKATIDTICQGVRKIAKRDAAGKKAFIAKALVNARFRTCQKRTPGLLKAHKDQAGVIKCFKEAKDVSALDVCNAYLKTGKRPEPKAGPTGCPNSAACLNGCRSKCEGKHGKLMDTAKFKACVQKDPKDKTCVKQAGNEAGRQCFLKCRGLSK